MLSLVLLVNSRHGTVSEKAQGHILCAVQRLSGYVRRLRNVSELDIALNSSMCESSKQKCSSSFVVVVCLFFAFWRVCVCVLEGRLEG